MGTVPTTPDPCAERVRKARAEAYAEGLSDVLDLARPARCAWSVERDETTKSFYWSCGCGEVVIQNIGEIEGIRDLLLAHITGSTTTPDSDSSK